MDNAITMRNDELKDDWANLKSPDQIARKNILKKENNKRKNNRLSLNESAISEISWKISKELEIDPEWVREWVMTRKSEQNRKENLKY